MPLFCKWIASQSYIQGKKYKDREYKSKNTAAGQPHRERRFGLGAPYAEQVEIAWMYSPLNYKDIEDQWESGFPRSMRKQDQATGAACTLDLPPKLHQAPNQRKILYIDAGPARTAPPNPCCSSESRKGSDEYEPGTRLYPGFRRRRRFVSTSILMFNEERGYL
ncbi:hypothetical protein B0H13DRAFT_1897079 [Mycena leptocephala]|nr:hypothetical protein B0H13DRAFT_1897079 [Mycena leptocephala]